MLSQTLCLKLRCNLEQLSMVPDGQKKLPNPHPVHDGQHAAGSGSELTILLLCAVCAALGLRGKQWGAGARMY